MTMYPVIRDSLIFAGVVFVIGLISAIGSRIKRKKGATHND